MTKKRTFVSFDYDHDLDLKNLFVGQAMNPNTPFEVVDFSIKEASKDWRERARSRIKGCDVVVIICGEHTNTAGGVAVELSIAQEEGVPCFLVKGRADKTCVRPTTAPSGYKMYRWTWENVMKLMDGQR